MKLKSYKRKKNEGEEPKCFRLQFDPSVPSPHPVFGPCLYKLLLCTFWGKQFFFLHLAFFLSLCRQVQCKDEDTEMLRGRPGGLQEQTLGPRMEVQTVQSRCSSHRCKGLFTCVFSPDWGLSGSQCQDHKQSDLE